MDSDVAGLVLAVITAVGAVVWLAGLRFLTASARRGRVRDAAGAEEGADEGREGWLTGSAEVEGEPGTLSARAAAILAKGNSYTLGPVRILEKADDRVRFERVDAALADRRSGHWFRRGELRFTALRPGRTRVEWAVEPGSPRFLLWLGGGFLAAGLVALVAGCWALNTFVVSNPNPALRWQTMQMLQAVHFLWPPFLFGAIYSRVSRAVASQLEALANNLPYCDGQG